MRYCVQITETLQREVLVEAASYRDAEKEVRKKYRQGEIVLSADDHVETEFAEMDESADSCLNIVDIE